MGFGPELLIPLALGAASSVGGALMQGNAQKQAAQDAQMRADARNKQLQEYRLRMQKLQDESTATNKKAQDLFTPEQSAARETTANQQLQDQYTKVTTPTPMQGDVPLAGSAPAVVKDAVKASTDKTNSYTDLLSKRLAALGTQPASLFSSGLDLGRAGSQIDQSINFGKQETALLPQYQDFSDTYYRLKPPASSPGGQMLSGLGQTFFNMAGSGWSTK
jgi:hypothetical protein